MAEYKNPPNSPTANFSDADSFMNQYKVSIRRARTAFLDIPHYHEFISIWYTVSGNYRMTLNDKKLQCPEGTVLFILPYTVHAMDTRNVDMDKTEIISFSIPADALHKKNIPFYPLTYKSAVFNGMNLPLHIQLSGEDKKAADNLVLTALSEYHKKQDMHITKIFPILNDFLFLCSKQCTESASPSKLNPEIRRFEKIYIATRKIKDNFVSPPSIDLAANASDMSRRSFTSAFREITNSTYHDMTISIKIAESIKLLKYTTKSIAEIALECGFSDNAHFSRVCTKLMATSPHTLRRQMIEITRLKEEHSEKLEDLHGWESHLSLETRREHWEIATGRQK